MAYSHHQPSETKKTIENIIEVNLGTGAKTIEEQEKFLQEQADKLSLLVSSNDDLYARFQSNMLAFKEYYPEIYDFYKQYEPQNYVVDIVDGFVNGVNPETGNYIYPYPSYLSTKLQFDNFLQSSAIKTFHFGEESAEQEEVFVHAKLLDNFKSIPKNQEKPSLANRKHLCSLLVLGVGTGYHIEMLVQKFTTQCIYIVEPDLDLFLLSLFTINWQFVLDTVDQKGGSIFISLGEQQESFFDDLAKASRDRGQYQISHIAGYTHYQSKQINDMLAQFNRRYFEMGLGWGFFDDGVISIGNMLGNLELGVPLLKREAKSENNVFSYPVFVVGNGPSLDGLIDTIKAYQDKAIIIGCGSATSALYQYGIKPDIHCEQERTVPVAQQMDFYAPAEFLKSLLFVAPNVVHPEVFKRFDQSIMMAKAGEPSTVRLLSTEKAKQLYTQYRYVTPTVTNMGLSAGYELGFKEFYFFGIDLGHKKGGNHHSVKSLYYTKENQDKGLYLSKDDKKVEVEGNFGGEFLSDHFFLNSNRCFEAFIKSAPDMHCFNLSDGAKIKGTRPLKAEALANNFEHKEVLDKAALIQRIYQNSILPLSDELTASFNDGLEIEEFELLCRELKEFSSQPVTSFTSATDILVGNTKIIRKSSRFLHDLLIGTLSHVQVTLNQLLYGGKTEQEGIEAFKKGLTFYLDFLAQAPDFYRENARQKHVMDCNWIARLQSFENSL